MPKGRFQALWLCYVRRVEADVETIDTSGQALVDHWKWAADKGLMNANTAATLGAATRQVLGVIDDWKTHDVRALDVEDVLRRFQNKRSKDFKPKSLSTYKARFTQAVRLFLSYTDDPGGWKPGGSNTNGATRPKRGSTKLAVGNETAIDRGNTPAPRMSGLVEYPFPLREGRFAYLRLPVDLSAADVHRLTAYLNTLVMEPEPK
jgi:hypothetical protein